jgi:2-polyprenyl-6-methoxyphenol hydroxylase-like FAD-dependent oxidoreductase
MPPVAPGVDRFLASVRNYALPMRIAIAGGGMAGLGAALACARDGHEVMILERDATPMPESPATAFSWDRRGAPQVRHSHAFLARLRNLLRDQAPDVLDELFAAGATEIPFTAELPPTLTDRSAQPGDEDLVALACRRTTFEWVLRRAVLAQPGVEMHDGVAVEGLDFAPGRPPRVIGVAERRADLVLDARGPRSTSDPWLRSIGAAQVPEELHESGIVYFSRFYRLVGDPGTRPGANTAAVDLGYLKYAVFLGDNDTFSITYAVDARDEQLRKGLADADTFEAAARVLVAAEPWRAAGVSEPITGVEVMAGLRNRYRPLVVDGTPLVHGFLAVGDAAVCTNPLYGRGCSLALVHAFGLAGALREHGDDFDNLARAFAAFTDREIVPWFRTAVFQDEQARMQAAGEELPPEDPRAFVQGIFRDGLLPAIRTSPIVFRAFLRWFNLLSTPDALMGDPAIVNEVLAAYHAREAHPAPDLLGPPDRASFVEAFST